MAAVPTSPRVCPTTSWQCCSRTRLSWRSSATSPTFWRCKKNSTTTLRGCTGAKPRHPVAYRQQVDRAQPATRAVVEAAVAAVRRSRRVLLLLEVVRAGLLECGLGLPTWGRNSPGRKLQRRRRLAQRRALPAATTAAPMPSTAPFRPQAQVVTTTTTTTTACRKCPSAPFLPVETPRLGWSCRRLLLGRQGPRCKATAAMPREQEAVVALCRGCHRRPRTVAVAAPALVEVAAVVGGPATAAAISLAEKTFSQCSARTTSHHLHRHRQSEKHLLKTQPWRSKRQSSPLYPHLVVQRGVEKCGVTQNHHPHRQAWNPRTFRDTHPRG